MFELDNGTILGIGALIVAAISVALAIRQGKPADEAMTLALQALQQNREAMERYERLYAEGQATARQGFDTIAGIVRAVAPMTPWAFDDELADVLEDVQAPGPPSNLPPTP